MYTIQSVMHDLDHSFLQQKRHSSTSIPRSLVCPSSFLPPTYPHSNTIHGPVLPRARLNGRTGGRACGSEWSGLTIVAARGGEGHVVLVRRSELFICELFLLDCGFVVCAYELENEHPARIAVAQDAAATVATWFLW